MPKYNHALVFERGADKEMIHILDVVLSSDAVGKALNFGLVSDMELLPHDGKQPLTCLNFLFPIYGPFHLLPPALSVAPKGVAVLVNTPDLILAANCDNSRPAVRVLLPASAFAVE